MVWEDFRLKRPPGLCNSLLGFSVAKDLKLSGLNDGNLVSYNFGGQKCESVCLKSWLLSDL